MYELLQRLRTSVTAKLLFIGFLVLLLLIPMGMIERVIHERNGLYLTAKHDIMNAWGREQTIGGPVLTVPYRVYYTDDNGIERVRQCFAHFLPERLDVRGSLETEMRYRGIYQVPVYTAELQMSGRFASPDFARLGIPPEHVDWDEAYLAVAIADARGIREPMRLQSDLGDFTFEPGGVKVRGFDPQVVTPIPDIVEAVDPAGQQADGFRFAFDLKLNGTEKLAFLPLGNRTDVLLTSSWTSPSFFGAYLPEHRDIDTEGFSAEWKVLHLGRSYPDAWRNDEVPAGTIAASSFGVDLYVPVGTYQKSTRAAKYAVLFIGLSFLAFFMFEIFSGLRLHPFQYLLVGFANCLFYLLLLSISEHAGFAAAYALSAAASALLISGYSMSVLEHRGRGFVMLAIISGLYAFLYVTLRAEQYAMLIGALALFTILATIMYLTRRLDWYRITLGLGRESSIPGPITGANAAPQATPAK